jgi:hypothetical protein
MLGLGPQLMVELELHGPKLREWQSGGIIRLIMLCYAMLY